MARVSDENRARMEKDGSWKSFVAYRTYAKENGLPRPKPGSWGPEDADRFQREKAPDSVQGPGQQQTNANTGKGDAPAVYSDVKTAGGGPKYRESSEGRTKSSSFEAIAWVADNMSKKEVPTAPSAEAYNMLCWVRSGAVAKREFWLKMYPKLIPDKVDEEVSMSVEDDSAYSLCRIEEQLAALEATDIVLPGVDA